MASRMTLRLRSLKRGLEKRERRHEPPAIDGGHGSHSNG